MTCQPYCSLIKEILFGRIWFLVTNVTKCVNLAFLIFCKPPGEKRAALPQKHSLTVMPMHATHSSLVAKCNNFITHTGWMTSTHTHMRDHSGFHAGIMKQFASLQWLIMAVWGLQVTVLFLCGCCHISFTLFKEYTEQCTQHTHLYARIQKRTWNETLKELVEFHIWFLKIHIMNSFEVITKL